MPRDQVYGVNRRRIGDAVVTVVNDGFEDFSFDILSPNITENEARSLLAAAGLPTIPRMSVNCYVVQDGRQTVLIDAGDANCLGTGGKLQGALAAADINPGQIDSILLTHAHPDHIGGLMEDGVARFPNAELILHEKELRFWNDEENFSNAPQQLHAVRTLVLKTFETYRRSLRPVCSGEVLSGITIQPLFGHTPGHSGFLISSGPESVFLWGDIVHWPDIQIPRPEVSLTFDINREQAVETRIRLLDMLASESILIGGMHLNFPGFIRIHRDGSSYVIQEDRWLPYLNSGAGSA
jgi:glyoxylase-like metal-dependent hydrolase (beta-lactamase superfamily II)